MGAGQISTFIKVLLPILMPVALMVFLRKLIGDLAEYEVTVFLFQPRYQPLGLVIYSATGPDAGPDAQVMTFVYAVILMVLSGLALWFIGSYEARTKNRRSRQSKRQLAAKKASAPVRTKVGATVGAAAGATARVAK